MITAKEKLNNDDVQQQKESSKMLKMFKPGQATIHDFLVVSISALICSTITLMIAIVILLGNARADELLIGEWDSRLGGGVTPILSGFDSIQALHQFLPGGLAAANINALVIPGASVYREFAVDDLFNDFGGDTIRLYASFLVTSPPSGQIIMPTIFQVSEYQPGWTIAEQTFVCQGIWFCDNYIVGGGTLVGQEVFTGTGTLFPTFNANVGSPYIITEVMHFVNDLTAPAGDVGGAILTQPDPHHHAVPGPIVGAGLPGLLAALGGLLTLARRRRARSA